LPDTIASLNQSLLGRYLVEKEIGQGGMATVYLARDVRHERKVAIKILHPELAAVLGPERFVTEMKVTANLQHPHILPLFDSGTAHEQLFYVMPYVEGESLRDRLQREQQLPIEEAVRITTEVASALDYAHRHGVVHRDIKPENILLHDGSALVADFGIALAVSNAGGVRLTQTGLSLGTPQYMSPEQATGDRNIDGRTDVYSLGCVLYEMLIGEPPFTGPSSQAIVARVLTERALPMRARRDTIPPHVEDAVLKAVQRLPADRFATPQEFVEALRGARAVSAAAPAFAASSNRAKWPLVVAGLLVVAVTSVAAYAIGARSAARQGSAEWSIERLGGPPIAMGPRVSPDGKTVAFQAMVNGQTQVAVLTPSSGDWRVLTHDTTVGFVDDLSWAPDGSRIFYSRFFQGPHGVYSITPLGADDRIVLDHADAPQPLPDGSVLFERLNRSRRLQLFHYWPQSGRIDSLPASTPYVWGKIFYRAFPDGKEAMFLGDTSAEATAKPGTFVIDLSTHRARRVDERYEVNVGTSFTTTADGSAALIREPAGDATQIVAIPRDGSRRTRVLFAATAGINDLDAGADGSVYIDQIERPCMWFAYDAATRRISREDLLPNCASEYLPLAGGRVATAMRTGGLSHVVVVGVGQQPVPLIPVDGETRGPIAALGADRVMVYSGRQFDTLLIADLATGRVSGRLPGFKDRIGLAGSPDGRTVYYVEASAVWSMPAAGGAAKRIRDGDAVAVDPAGRYLVIETDAIDRTHLFHIPLDGSPETEIPIKSALPLSPHSIHASAIGPDGRIGVTGVSPAAWHWPGGLLDPNTGIVEWLPTGRDYDVTVLWSPDGKVVALGEDLRSGLWRLKPTQARAP
jgi:tRNA A-37 threonylcarbamoyl transferase component Bud32